MILRGFTQTTVITRGYGISTLLQLVDSVCTFFKEKQKVLFLRKEQERLFYR